MSNITAPIHNLIVAALAERRARVIPKDEPLISVSTRASRASFIYERMRAAVDYKEEHLVRRTAIERILRRNISLGKRKELTENLVNELVHARYLPNDAIPQRRLAELETLLEKYYRLLGAIPIQEINNPKSLPGWVLNIMATEVDEFLLPPHIMHASINAMYEVMNREIHIEDEIDAADRAKQIYIATSRTLYRNEENIRYHLFLLYFPDWKQADADVIKEVGAGLAETRDRIEIDLNHPLRDKLNAVMRKHVVYFSILTEIIAQDPQGAAQAMENNESFLSKINLACAEHYRIARGKLRRSIVRSITYLLLTKFLLAIILEIPVESWLLERTEIVPLAINIVFPPTLLAIVALSTKIPGEANTDLIARGITRIIKGENEIIQVKKSRRRKFITQLLFALLYAIMFGLCFGLLIYGLTWLNFTFISMFVFLLFLSLVSLFAFRIRRNAQELIVTPPKRGIIRSFWGFMTIPVLHAGKWMSTKFAQLNIFIFILDFVIEAPFKSVVKITEEWMNYVQEKKEEI